MTRKQSRSGMTILELVVSIPTATVLIGAMAMCVTVMMRARSQDDILFDRTYNLSKALNQIASDVKLATSHVSSSPSHLEFVVPDRNGDGLPEQMRYEWGGTTGANANRILWKYNTSPLSILFEDVGQFSLQMNHTTASSVVPNHLRAEVALLKSLDACPDGVFREQIVNSANHIGQYFVPDILGTGNRWDLGAIRIMAKSADSNTDGVLQIRVMQCDALTRLPTTPILAEIKIEEWRLGSYYQWLDLPIAPISWQAQGKPLCLTIGYASGTGDIAKIQFLENGTGMPSNTNLLTSNNGGLSWTASDSSRGLRFYAFGFYDGYTGNRKFLQSVDLRLGSALSTEQRLETSILLQAVPEVP
jgi:hypothetical protein